MRFHKKTKFFLSAGLVLLFFLFFGISLAYALEINYPRLPGAAPPQDFVNYPPDQIPSLRAKYFFNLAIWISGIIAFGALFYGGIRYLTSTGKPEAMVAAKDQISAAFLGLLILLSSFLILKTLSPQFIAPEISELPPVETIEIPGTSPPPIEEFQSSINTEVLEGRI
ncbi:unnamed protein product, partial [marine sediment metagenome]